MNVKILRIKTIFLLLALNFFCLQVICQDDCDLKMSTDSIFIYTCKVSDSRFKSIKANFIIKTTPEAFAANLLDVSKYPQWQYNNIEAAVLKKISNNEIIYRSEIKAIWPVSNRDLIMHLKITQNEVTNVMTADINSVPDFIPLREGVVRVPMAKAHWVIEPIGKSEIHLYYTLLIDPGGYIPVWMLNLALAEGPYKTLKNLKSRLNNVYK